AECPPMATAFPKVAGVAAEAGAAQIAAANAVVIREPCQRIRYRSLQSVSELSRLHAQPPGESIIDMAIMGRITKVSHVFPIICTYTARVGTGRPNMKRLVFRFASLAAGLGAAAAVFAPLDRAQSLGTTVRVRTVPEGEYFWVDGQKYKGAFSGL